MHLECIILRNNLLYSIPGTKTLVVARCVQGNFNKAAETAVIQLVSRKASVIVQELRKIIVDDTDERIPSSEKLRSICKVAFPRGFYILKLN